MQRGASSPAPPSVHKDALPGNRGRMRPHCPPAGRQDRLALPPRQTVVIRHRPALAPGPQRKRRGRQSPPPEQAAASQAAARRDGSVTAFLYCADELFSIFVEIENYTPPRICCSGPGDSLSPPKGSSGLPTTTEQGNQTHAHDQRKGHRLPARRRHQRHCVQHVHRVTERPSGATASGGPVPRPRSRAVPYPGLYAIPPIRSASARNSLLSSLPIWLRGNSAMG